MKRALLTVIAPVFSLSMTALVVMYPSPGDLRAALVPSHPKSMDTGARDVSEVIRDAARRALGPNTVAATRAGCFVGIDKADDERIAECGPLVVKALAELNAAKDRPEVQRAMREDTGKELSQRLRLAVTEVCRNQWAASRGASAIQTSPACQAADLQLVSIAR